MNNADTITSVEKARATSYAKHAISMVSFDFGSKSCIFSKKNNTTIHIPN